MISTTTTTKILRAIRRKCLDCCCEDAKTVRECPISDCPLYQFRLGKSCVEREETKNKK